MFTLFVLLFLSSCTSLPKITCEQIDWAKAARDDVHSGGYTTHFREGASICQKEGKLADIEHYQMGKEEALKTFCTKDNAYEWGRSGHSNLNLCPELLAEDFQKSYTAGLKDFQIQVEDTRARLHRDDARIAEKATDNKIKETIETWERAQAEQFMRRRSYAPNSGFETTPLPSVFDRNR